MIFGSDFNRQGPYAKWHLIDGEQTDTVASPIDPRLNAHPSPMMQKAKIAWLDK